MLHIWLTGLEPEKNVIKELYEALVAIDRKAAAGKVINYVRGF